MAVWPKKLTLGKENTQILGKELSLTIEWFNKPCQGQKICLVTK